MTQFNCKNTRLLNHRKTSELISCYWKPAQEKNLEYHARTQESSQKQPYSPPMPLGLPAESDNQSLPDKNN